jgi:hypothetical protein
VGVPGPNPTTLDYNTSITQRIKYICSIARICVCRVKNPYLKNSLAYYNAGVVAVNLKKRRIGSCLVDWPLPKLTLGGKPGIRKLQKIISKGQDTNVRKKIVFFGRNSTHQLHPRLKTLDKKCFLLL